MAAPVHFTAHPAHWAMPDEPDAVLSRLYQAPLADFVATRKALAEELKAAGQRDAARALMKRPKPRPAAWTANQLHYREPQAVAGALSAARALAAAQAQGGRSVGDMQGLLAERAQAIRFLLELGQAIASDAGTPLSRPQERELQNTLEAWSAQPDRCALGQLDRAIEPPSFELLDAASVLAARPPAAAPAESEATPPHTGDSRDSQRAQDALAARQRAAAARLAQRKQAEASAARLAADAERAREHVKRAEAQLTGAQAQAEALRQQLVRAEQRSQAAATELSDARKRLDAAQVAQAQAETAAKALAPDDEGL